MKPREKFFVIILLWTELDFVFKFGDKIWGSQHAIVADKAYGFLITPNVLGQASLKLRFCEKTWTFNDPETFAEEYLDSPDEIVSQYIFYGGKNYTFCSGKRVEMTVKSRRLVSEKPIWILDEAKSDMRDYPLKHVKSFGIDPGKPAYDTFVLLTVLVK